MKQLILNQLKGETFTKDEVAAAIDRAYAEKHDLSFVAPEFKEVFTEWLTYKRERKESYKTPTSIKAAYKRLLRFSYENPIRARLIVEQSIENNWSGFFELKNERKQQGRNIEAKQWLIDEVNSLSKTKTTNT